MAYSLPAVTLPAATWHRQPQQQFVTRLLHAKGARWGCRPWRPGLRRGATLQQPATASSGEGSDWGETRGHQPAADILASSEPQLQPPTDPWEQARQQVIGFQQQHGRLPRANADASGPLVPGERPLGLWCADQQRRKAGSKGQPLTVQEQASLASIPGWSWWPSKRRHVSWEERLQQLQEFVQQHCGLPRQAARSGHRYLPGEKELGTWVHTQRKRYKGQQPPQLSVSEVAALEAVPGWYWAAFAMQPWEQSYQQVREFVRQHGRLPRQTAGSDHPFLPGEMELGKWCPTQRNRYKGQRLPQLSAKQLAALETVPGWYWAAYEVQPWEQRLEQLHEFVQQHGRLPRHTARSGHPFLPSEKELGSWVSMQRECYKGNRQRQLSAEQVAALESVPGWYWAAFQIQPWEWWYQQVAEFMQRHGRVPRVLPSSQAPLLPGEKQLGSWCFRQRQRWKGQRHAGAPLTPQQQAALQELGGWYCDGSPGRADCSDVAL